MGDYVVEQGKYIPLTRVTLVGQKKTKGFIIVFMSLDYNVRPTKKITNVNLT